MQRSRLPLAVILLAVVVTMMPAAAATTRVSVATGGAEGTGPSTGCSVSADGRYVAFASTAPDLVANDLNGKSDVFIRDLTNGTTWRVSLGDGGAEANGDSFSPSISADGGFVAFTSEATNLPLAPTSGSQTGVYLHNVATSETRRVDAINDAEGADANSGSPSVSEDGRYVAFLSSASNIASLPCTYSQVLVRDMQQTGPIPVASRHWNAGDVPCNGDCTSPAISADGTCVAFASVATDLIPDDTNSSQDVFRWDFTQSGMARMSVDPNGDEVSGQYPAVAISGDGDCVVFSSNATALVAGDTNGCYDVFLRDWSWEDTYLISAASDGTQGNGDSLDVAVDQYAGYIAYSSLATNLVRDDTNGVADVFVSNDRGQTTRVSRAADGSQSGGASGAPAIGADQRTVAYSSEAANLVPDDTNGVSDVFASDTEFLPWTAMFLESAHGHLGHQVDLWACLIDADEKSLAGATVSFWVEGVFVGTGVTDAGGWATVLYTVTQAPGDYEMMASFAGDGVNDGCYDFSELHVDTTILTVADANGAPGDGVNLQATLLEDGVPIAGAEIEFYVDGTYVDATTTGVDGVATLPYTITQGLGSYYIDAYWEGDIDHEEEWGWGVLTVATSSPTELAVGDAGGETGGTANLTATLTSGGVGVAGCPIDFTVGGNSAGTATTDGNGSAVLPYPITEGVGSYPIGASFAGNAQYAPSAGTGTLTVTRIATWLAVPDVRGAVGANVALTATLGAGAQTLGNMPVAFRVGGVDVGVATTAPNGVATINYLVPHGLPTAEIRATFAGDATYEGCTNAGTLYRQRPPALWIIIVEDPVGLPAGEAQTYHVVTNWGVDITEYCLLYVSAAAGGSWNANTYTCEKAGSWTVSAVYDCLTDEASLTVSHLPAVSVALSPQCAHIAAAGAYTYTVTGTDAFGNCWNALLPASAWTVGVVGGGTQSGAFDATNTYQSVAGDGGKSLDISCALDGAVSNHCRLSLLAPNCGYTLAWDWHTRAFYLCGDASSPATGVPVAFGTNTYTIVDREVTVRVSGGTQDQTASITNCTKANSLRVRWYLSGTNLYRAYQTATVAGRSTTCNWTSPAAFTGLTMTASGYNPGPPATWTNATSGAVLQPWQPPQVAVDDPHRRQIIGRRFQRRLVLCIVAVRPQAELHPPRLEAPEILQVLRAERRRIARVVQVRRQVDLHRLAPRDHCGCQLVVHRYGDLAEVVQPWVSGVAAVRVLPAPHPPPGMCHDVHQLVSCQEHDLAVVVADHRVALHRHVQGPVNTRHHILNPQRLGIRGRESQRGGRPGRAAPTQAIDGARVLPACQLVQLPLRDTA